MSGQQMGLPPALYLIDGYRPQGRAQPGTVSLDDVLGVLGFQKLANVNLATIRGARIPIDLQLEGGHVSRAVIDPQGLVEVLGRLSGSLPESESLVELLEQAPPFDWEVHYRDLGAPTEIMAPPAARVIELGDDCGD